MVVYLDRRPLPRSPVTTYAQYWAVVRRIPRGRVATYGQVALLAGLPGRARQAGYALAALPDESDVPWHRVVNARGEVSRRAGGSAFGTIQRVLLEAEGVAFDASGRIPLERYRWRPSSTAPRRKNTSTTARK
jgi:methylated-DNA-protein-cysteine methyltransferase-like protein